MADIPQYKPDYRLWVDNIDDLKLLVDEANNFRNSRLTIGTILYVQEEDKYYSIKGQGHQVIGYEPLKVSSGNIFFGPDEPNDLSDEELAETLWIVHNEDDDAEDYARGYNVGENIITEMRLKIANLEKQVFSLMSIIEHGAIAGDSTHGARTSIMDTYPLARHPLTEEEEETYDSDTTKPNALLATIPNLAIKHDTAVNFKTNYQNLINGELIWIRNGENITAGDPGLYIYAANKLYVGFIPIGSGTGSGSNPTPGGDPSPLINIEINSAGVLDILSNNVSVNENGILVINDTTNFSVKNGVLHILPQNTPDIPQDNQNNNSPNTNSVSANVSNTGIVNITGNDINVNQSGILSINNPGILSSNNIINLHNI